MMTMWRFIQQILGMAWYWQIWIFALFSTNMAGVWFLPRVEAWVVLGALLVGAFLQMTLFARFGFVRLLGLGHLHWLPMLVWLSSRLGAIQGEGVFYNWVVAVMAVCGLSLVVDVVDVIRYSRGEREPTILGAT